MILLWGLSGDTPLASVRNELTRMERTAVLIDQRAVLETSVELTAGDNVACTVEWNGLRVNLEKVTAAYLRPYDPLGVPAVTAAGMDSAASRHAVDVYEALRVWSEMTSALVVNRLSAMGSNSSKPYQLELIRAAGFAVPETLVTTDPAAAAAFCDRLGDVVYKSVSGVRSIVSRVTPEKRAQLDAVSACAVPGVRQRRRLPSPRSRRRRLRLRAGLGGGRLPVRRTPGLGSHSPPGRSAGRNPGPLPRARAGARPAGRGDRSAPHRRRRVVLFRGQPVARVQLVRCA
jgi:hypothetical protein